MGCRCIKDKENAIFSISFKKTIQEVPPRFAGDDFISENSISGFSVIPVVETSRLRGMEDISFFVGTSQK